MPGSHGQWSCSRTVSREFVSDMKCRFKIRVKNSLTCSINLNHFFNPWYLFWPSARRTEALWQRVDAGAGECIISLIGLVSLLKSLKGTIILFLVTLSMAHVYRNDFSFSQPGSLIVRSPFAGPFIHWNWFYKQAPCQLFFSCFLGKGSDMFIVLVFVTMAKYLTLSSLMLMW